MKNRFSSTDPQDIAWRIEQAKVDNFIEGVSPDRTIEEFVMKLNRDGITDTNDRIRRIGEFLKAKENGAE